MKTQFFPISPLSALLCLVLGLACQREQTPQFTLNLSLGDGSSETQTLVPGSMFLVSNGQTHVVAQALAGTEDALELEVRNYMVSRDSMSRDITIKQTGSNTNKIALKSDASLDAGGTIHVNLQSVAMIDTGRHPIGACKGKCCEAKCFSTFCCGDQFECKDKPCDCKPPSNCPTPQPNPQAGHFFEVFRSGKDVMVFKE